MKMLALKPLRRTRTVLFLIMILLLSAIKGTIFINSAAAFSTLPTITIRSDGTIAPKAEFIKQDGNTYTLTADLIGEYAIVIQRGNIVFDGAGHLIGGSFSYFGYANVGLAIDNIDNVIVKNVKISGFGMTDIFLNSSSHCSVSKVDADFLYVGGGVDNEIADNTIGRLHLEAAWKNSIINNSITGLLLVENSSDNLFVKNNIYDIFFRDNNNGNTFYANNFWRCKGNPGALHFFEFVGTNFWDNGSIGNYWFDYDGKDLNFDGIGDTPYFIKTKARDELTDKVVEIVIAQDNYPLMNPYDIEKDVVVKPPVTLFTAVLTVFVLTSAYLIIYFKKGKHKLK